MSRLTLLLLMGLLSACSSATLRLMPTPTLLTQSQPALFDTGSASAGSPAIEVLYATNRLPVGSPDKRNYSRTRSDELRLGVATLRVGDGTKTWESLQAMSTSTAEGERPEISLIGAREMAVLGADAPAAGPDARAFFALVDELLTRSGDRDLLIYLHGARTDFDRAAAQAAQFQHFMGPDAVVMVFAWPSAGSLLRAVATSRP
jgi:esterase/lipase superfamily enzyme